MSSTPDRLIRRERREGGQVLAIFAFGIIGILAIAALVFDVGQLIFERRSEQNAADAAALAGARFLSADPACKSSPVLANCTLARNEALYIAAQHGYDASKVTIRIPPGPGSPFAGLPFHMEVGISSNRGSFFAGVLGLPGFRVAASAIARNTDSYSLPYSFLSLNPNQCNSGNVGGNGSIVVEGEIYVSSTCTSSGAMTIDGSNANIQATRCATAGEIKWGGSDVPVAPDSCGSPAEGIEGVTGLGDPLSGLKIGAAPPVPAAISIASGSGTLSAAKQRNCPGGTNPASATSPSGCEIVPQNGSPAVTINPGTYYGGLALKQNNASNPLTVYLKPGIYYMAGGGFLIDGADGMTVKTVDNNGVPCGDPGATLPCGVLIYNTAGPGSTTIAAIDITNTDNTDIDLYGYSGRTFTTLLFWQDASVASQPALKISGQATMTLHGTIYLPKADFDYAGNGSGEVLEAQVICDQFSVTGNGSLTVDYDPDDAYPLRGTGLVQ